MQRAFLVVLAPSCSMTISAAVVPAPTSPAPEVLYHYGDNPRWANPSVDDSAWPSAKDGVFPSPAYQSDGYFCVRTRVPVPAGNTGPFEPPTIAGWRVQAAYVPTADVGDDFYHVIKQAVATLLLTGDVSGKGLKAAMTGLLTIGASALAAECATPPQLLARLNREMVRLQKGAFVTCLCVRIAADGAMTIANVGHLAPYRNGEEIQMPGSLPLGISPTAEVPLAPVDQFVFLSDGVVEAQSPTGELFGFDRTAAISTQSAESIARAAQHFGQEDDITVLTLTFAPSEVLHA
jgi:hypothetical protein